MQRNPKISDIQGRHWRKYQRRLKTKWRRREAIQATRRWAVPILLIVGILFVGGSYLGNVPRLSLPSGQADSSLQQERLPAASPAGIGKEALPSLVSSSILAHLGDKRFEIIKGGNRFFVETTIAPTFQDYIRAQLDLTHSSRIGVVAMNPETGEVLAMVGYNANEAKSNACIDPTFPAASVFKIVTTAAAIESQGIRPDTVLSYNGRKYTLYRSQISQETNRYTHRISLQDSFAQSVNPVFGKLGALSLSAADLKTYASAFGFNQQIAFDLKLPPSRVTIPEGKYERAEIASGFNRETRLSPLHGAVVASSLINGGKLLEPSVVESITEPSGKILYQRQTKMIGRPIEENTAGWIDKLMMETIRSGTCKKTFRGHQKDQVLSRLTIGGKTGSIGSDTPGTRFDWFVGFAQDEKRDHALAISIVVVHEKFIGTRSSEYARKIMKHYFQNLAAVSAEAKPQQTAPSSDLKRISSMNPALQRNQT